jgi:hypothetical protein
MGRSDLEPKKRLRVSGKRQDVPLFPGGYFLSVSSCFSAGRHRSPECELNVNLENSLRITLDFIMNKCYNGCSNNFVTVFFSERGFTMGKGQTIAGFVLALCGLVTGFFGGWCSVFALPMAIVGLILAIVGGNNLRASGQPSGLATAGLVIGIIAVVFASILFFTCGLCKICAEVGESAFEGAFDELYDELY